MAKTVLEAFNQFRSNLEITDYQQDKVSARQQNVRNAIANGRLSIKEDFLTGSYIKKTMVRPMSENDIDLFIVFHEQHASHFHGQGQVDGPKRLIEYVRNTIRPTYPYTSTRADGQALVLKFNDKINVDIVPAFISTAGHYLIPNLNSSSAPWIHTNPKTQSYWLTYCNKNSGNMIIPFIKMVKYWNKANNIGLTSFHIEALVLKHFSGKSFNSYTEASRSFFSQLSSLLSLPIHDPVNISGRIDTYLDLFQTMGMNTKVAASVKRIPPLGLPSLSFLSPFGLSNIGSDSADITGWRSFYGGLFPAYG